MKKKIFLKNQIWFTNKKKSNKKNVNTKIFKYEKKSEFFFAWCRIKNLLEKKNTI